MAVLPSFKSSATEALKRIHKGSFESSSQRDELIETVLAGGEEFRAKDFFESTGSSRKDSAG
jgi:hypothetical protein